MTAPEIKVIAGLGNPGRQYEDTRHNIGFTLADLIAAHPPVENYTELKLPCTSRVDWRSADGMIFAEARIGPWEGIVLKPQTFMNLSGEAVGPFMRYRRWEAGELLVVHDEIDLPLGSIRLKLGGGHGGHNGIRSIETHLGSPAFYRIRLGIGRPDASMPDGVVKNWVLGRFSPEERPVVDDLLRRSYGAVKELLKNGISAAQNHFNR